MIGETESRRNGKIVTGQSGRGRRYLLSQDRRRELPSLSLLSLSALSPIFRPSVLLSTSTLHQVNAGVNLMRRYVSSAPLIKTLLAESRQLYFEKVIAVCDVHRYHPSITIHWSPLTVIESSNPLVTAAWFGCRVPDLRRPNIRRSQI